MPLLFPQVRLKMHATTVLQHISLLKTKLRVTEIIPRSREGTWRDEPADANSLLELLQEPRGAFGISVDCDNDVWFTVGNRKWLCPESATSSCRELKVHLCLDAQHSSWACVSTYSLRHKAGVS